MIELKNVCKQFGSVEVLSQIALEIQTGEIVGFLGHNGAGKTTLMRIMTTYLPATSGQVFIDGKNAATASLAIRAKIGYLPEKPPLYPNMTVNEYLTLAGRLHNVRPRDLKGAIASVCAECWLTDVQNSPIAILSKGYQQRVGIAQAIIHNPAILILDEPTSGLDPLQVVQVRALIKRCQSQRTVIVSTHILSEIEHLATRVVIIKQGTIAADASVEEVIRTQQSNTLEEAFLKLNRGRSPISC
ncbi:MAG: ABC transporter ATP-binding protein [Candidatus Omnitrophica bacterium]|nr:ABC transporter ATP-binding protein [Candidatus Omnitrophota bacterium]